MTTSNMCPECGPHGGQGRVLLLDSWVDCTACDQTAADAASTDAVASNRALRWARPGRYAHILLPDGSLATLKDGQHVRGCSCSECIPRAVEFAGREKP